MSYLEESWYFTENFVQSQPGVKFIHDSILGLTVMQVYIYLFTYISPLRGRHVTWLIRYLICM